MKGFSNNLYYGFILSYFDFAICNNRNYMDRSDKRERKKPILLTGFGSVRAMYSQTWWVMGTVALRALRLKHCVALHGRKILIDTFDMPIL